MKENKTQYKKKFKIEIKYLDGETFEMATDLTFNKSFPDPVNKDKLIKSFKIIRL